MEPTQRLFLNRVQGQAWSAFRSLGKRFCRPGRLWPGTARSVHVQYTVVEAQLTARFMLPHHLKPLQSVLLPAADAALLRAMSICCSIVSTPSRIGQQQALPAAAGYNDAVPLDIQFRRRGDSLRFPRTSTLSPGCPARPPAPAQNAGPWSRRKRHSGRSPRPRCLWSALWFRYSPAAGRGHVERQTLRRLCLSSRRADRPAACPAVSQCAHRSPATAGPA